MNFQLDQSDIDRLADAVAQRLAAPVRKTQWLTRAEAAEHLRCSVWKLDELVRLGEVPVYRPSRTPLFRPEDLDQYVVANRREH